MPFVRKSIFVAVLISYPFLTIPVSAEEISQDFKGEDKTINTLFTTSGDNYTFSGINTLYSYFPSQKVQILKGTTYTINGKTLKAHYNPNDDQKEYKLAGDLNLNFDEVFYPTYPDSGITARHVFFGLSSEGGSLTVNATKIHAEPNVPLIYVTEQQTGKITLKGNFVGSQTLNYEASTPIIWIRNDGNTANLPVEANLIYRGINNISVHEKGNPSAIGKVTEVTKLTGNNTVINIQPDPEDKEASLVLTGLIENPKSSTFNLSLGKNGKFIGGTTAGSVINLDLGQNGGFETNSSAHGEIKIVGGNGTIKTHHSKGSSQSQVINFEGVKTPVVFQIGEDAADTQVGEHILTVLQYSKDAPTIIGKDSKALGDYSGITNIPAGSGLDPVFGYNRYN